MIGILGGVASGKSLVSQCFAELGAVVLDADQVGHQVLRLPEVKERIRAAFGGQVFDCDGEVGRPALAKIVFAPDAVGSAALETLEGITHLEIAKRLLEEIDRLKSSADSPPAAILDAPVMLKTNLADQCDKIVYVEATDAVRRERALQRGWSDEQWRQREAAQAGSGAKRKVADVIVENSGAMDETRRQIEALWRDWQCG